jgi:hypothetical protein
LGSTRGNTLFSGANRFNRGGYLEGILYSWYRILYIRNRHRRSLANGRTDKPPLCRLADDPHAAISNAFRVGVHGRERNAIHLFLELALAAFARRVGGDGGRERGLVVEVGFGNAVERFAVGFPGRVVGGLSEDTADGLVVEEFGSAEEEGGLEARSGDLVGL